MELRNIVIHTPQNKEVGILFDENGFVVDSEEELAIHELHYISAVIFVYLSGEARKIPLDLNYVHKVAKELYEKTYGGRSPIIKRVEEMTEREFNREVLEWEIK